MEFRCTVSITLEVPASDARLLGPIDTVCGAARTVDFTHLRRWPTSTSGDAPRDVRRNTGTMIESGCAPAPTLVRSGVHGVHPQLT